MAAGVLVVNHHTVNILWLGNVIWRHRIYSTVIQPMTCCLTASSHCLNRFWQSINEILWHSPESNFTGGTEATPLKIIIFELLPHLKRASNLTSLILSVLLFNIKIYLYLLSFLITEMTQEYITVPFRWPGYVYLAYLLRIWRHKDLWQQRP